MAKYYTPVKAGSNVLAIVALLAGPTVISKYQNSIALSHGANKIKLDLMEELANQGIKYNPDDIIVIGRDPSGKVVWLEKGNPKAGLEHIISRHGEEFIQKGISLEAIPDYLINSLENGKLIGYQGRGTGRPIYELWLD